jgi:hypothetical protein
MAPGHRVAAKEGTVMADQCLKAHPVPRAEPFDIQIAVRKIEQRRRLDVIGPSTLGPGHALVKGRPILPTLAFLFVPLLLAICPFGCVFGPLYLSRLPLSFGPVLDSR